MKKLTLLLTAVFAFTVLSFAQADYTMYRTVYITPKYDKLKELGKVMAEHNKEYHSEGPNQAYIWLIQTGPHTGDWLYVFGPATFTEMDNIDMAESHKDHWISEVMPFVADVSNGEYWRMDDELTWIPKDFENPGKEVLTFFEVKDFEEYRFKAILEKVQAVYEAKAYDHFFQVYNTQFSSACGRDVLIAGSFANWAFFDKDRTFKKDFEELHGEGSWSMLMEEYKDVVVSSYDEIIIYSPELSGVE